MLDKPAPGSTETKLPPKKTALLVLVSLLVNANCTA